jgi:hypothetical protein
LSPVGTSGSLGVNSFMWLDAGFFFKNACHQKAPKKILVAKGIKIQENI